MATTTNYGWTTPDDTALVKDGAAAIRTLGSSVDTTTKNLNPSTTLGDIEYRSSTSNVNTRLAIGTTGQVLAVSGGVPAWTTSAGSAMVHIATTAFSNVATQDFSAVFSATYKSYLIVINKISAATYSNALHLQLRYGSSVFAGTYYGDSFVYGGANTNSPGGTELIISSATGGAGYTSGGFFYIYNAADASGWATVSGQYTDGVNLSFKSFGGIAYGANNYNGFRLKSSSSNITGNVSIYGLANS